MNKNSLRTGAFFGLGAALIVALVAAVPYAFRDSDSSCYDSLSRKLAARPLPVWCAPEWGGHGGNQGLFIDHPPGILWLPALLNKIGIKGTGAALGANVLYLYTAFFFVFLLFGRKEDRVFGWAALFAFILSPIFFQYLVRANQEPALNLAVFMGIYGLRKSEESGRYRWLYFAALVFAVFFKGVGAWIVGLSGVLYWLFAGRSRKIGFIVGQGILIALASAALFEIWYRGVTGLPFWSRYYAFQSGQTSTLSLTPWAYAYNLLWYLSRILVFTLPWSLVLVYLGVRKGIAGLKIFFRQEPLAPLFLACAGAMTLFYSVFERKADRYIFPAYALISIVAALYLLHASPKLKAFLARREALYALGLNLFLIAATALRLYFHARHYRFIRL